MLVKLVLLDGTKISKVYDRPIPDQFLEAIYLVKEKQMKLLNFKRKSKNVFQQVLKKESHGKK